MVEEFDVNEGIEDLEVAKPFWKTEEFYFIVNVTRIALVVLMIIIIYKLWVDIDEVKILGSDACELCMNKTGAECFLIDNVIANQEAKEKQAEKYKDRVNTSGWEELIDG